MLPKMTAPRLLILVGFLIACTLAHEALPSPVRSLAVLVAIGGGPAILRHWMRLDARGDEADREDVPDEDVSDNVGGIWRVRIWVRVVSVAIPLLGLPFVLEPQLLNPDWENGMPAPELVVVLFFYAVLGLAAWAAFRSRLEVDAKFVRVINPWNAQSFLRATVSGARSGRWGLELLLDDGRVIVAFAVQCVSGMRAGYRPRWVDVARTITGRDPVE